MTPDQHRRIRQALANHRRPPRTHGARIREAIEHAKKKGRVMGPALKDISTDETISVDALADKEIRNVHAAQYNPLQ